jgi:hypothetical protein
LINCCLISSDQNIQVDNFTNNKSDVVKKKWN